MATQAEVAEQLGLSDRWLRKLVEDKVLSDPGRGKWDVLRTARQLIDYRGREIERLKAHVASLESQSQRSELGGKALEDARKARAQADIAEMEAAQMKVQLVPIGDVAEPLHNAVQIMKTRIMAVPAKAATQVGAKSPAHAKQVIEKYVIEALEGLSKIRVQRAAGA